MTPIVTRCPPRGEARATKRWAAFRYDGIRYRALLAREPSTHVALQRFTPLGQSGGGRWDDVPTGGPASEERDRFALACIALAHFEPEARYRGLRTLRDPSQEVAATPSEGATPLLCLVFDYEGEFHEALVFEEPVPAVAVVRLTRRGRRVFAGYAAHDGQRFEDTLSRYALLCLTCASIEAQDPRLTRYFGPIEVEDA
ncbi:MAG: hypothetical protein R3B72_51870 [Polyangiaceae bacterium]